ncbi:MAG: S8 family serine peptidase, partial [Saprospiraceae bacterium]|nr:S8 family serine peptidase [Saprospiraceae bacterium]
VGILDRGHFSEGEPYSHVDVLRKIIEDPGFVNVQNMPMVDDPGGEATTFDMICALSNRKWINRVDLINISQGHYAFAPHPILHKILKCLDKIIVCSAGNDHLDNDQTGHWPSNFSLNLDHLLGIANVGQSLTLHPTSNFGNDSVTIAASGEFGATLFGTSYATAWVSRMIALSYALNGRNDLTLAEIIDQIRQIYQVQFNTSDQTLSKVRFLAVKK